MKITTRCGAEAVAGLNEALLAKAAGAKLLRTNKVRADTTVVGADVGYPTDSGLLAKAIGSMARGVKQIKAAGGAVRTRARDRRRSAGRRARSIASKLRLRDQQQRDQAQAAVRRITGELAGIAEAAQRQTCAAHCERAAQSPAAPGNQPLDHRGGPHPACGGADPKPTGRGDARLAQQARQPA
jgi:IS5 family transposase